MLNLIKNFEIDLNRYIDDLNSKLNIYKKEVEIKNAKSRLKQLKKIKTLIENPPPSSTEIRELFNGKISQKDIEKSKEKKKVLLEKAIKNIQDTPTTEDITSLINILNK